METEIYYNYSLIDVEPSIISIIYELKNRGHKALLVGGCVRDAILNIKPKDIDIEVYQISYNDLKDFLSDYGRCDLVGKAFGTIKFHPHQATFGGYDGGYDFSIPRKENKVGIGHKSFEVSFDLDMTIADASARRDITFNALSYDPIENKLYDYFGGLEDLKNGIIRHTSEMFKDDPLRIERLMQFQSRFGFKIHTDTMKIIMEMLATGEYESLPKERRFEEWKKWAEKGIHHDLIFDFMRDTNLIDYYPELKALKECQQDATYHPEGDVEIHTKMCLAEMDKIIVRENISGTEKLILVMAILLHDIAKPATSKEELKIDRKTGKERLTITSNGHEAMGGEMARPFLAKLGFHNELIDPICNLISNHLAGVSIRAIGERKGQTKAVKRLSRRLAPASIQQLIYLMEADHNGRGGEREVAVGRNIIKEISQELDVQKKPYEYILMGRHLIDAGLKPSPKFKDILKKAEQAQEEGEFSNLDAAKEWLKNNLS